MGEGTVHPANISPQPIRYGRKLIEKEEEEEETNLSLSCLDSASSEREEPLKQRLNYQFRSTP